VAQRQSGALLKPWSGVRSWFYKVTCV